MDTSFLTGVIFFFAFGGLVFIHEFGHFITARLLRVEVEEFGFGLPPRALILFRWKGTAFTLNWLPIGGFVRPKGENDPNVPGGLAASSPWIRLAVLMAGPFMNLIAAVFIYSLIFARIGIPDVNRVLVSSVGENTPAQQGGLQEGDIFVSGNSQPIQSYADLRAVIESNIDQPVNFIVDRSGEKLEFTVTPQMNAEAQRVMIGVGLGNPFTAAKTWFETLPLSVETTYYAIDALVSLPAKLIRGDISSNEGRVIGLKGIYDILERSVSHDVQASEAPASSSPIDQPVRTLDLIASLTISLGVFNLFPFPALDGGRIIFVLPELILRRRVPHQFENLVHGIGMALLILLMVYVNLMDFIRPVSLP